MRMHTGVRYTSGRGRDVGDYVVQLEAASGRKALRTRNLQQAIRAARKYVSNGKISGDTMTGVARALGFGPERGLLAGPVTCAFWCDGRRLTAAEMRRAAIEEAAGFRRRLEADKARIKRLDQDLEKIR